MRRMTVACAIATAALTAVTASGCVRVELPEPQQGTADDHITRDGATELTASIDMGAGRLTVTGGADDLMDATYEFSDEAWRPEVRYRVDAGEGILSVESPTRPRIDLSSRMRYDWEIALADDVPLTLSVAMGAGESELSLGSLDLRRLSVDMGAGDAAIDLTGTPQHDLSAEINAGAGAITLRVPVDVGVRIVGYQDGIGTYRADGFTQDGDALVNDAYGVAPVSFDIILRRGLGDVTVETIG
ncbi:MAG: toast rack family protein [Coriobacteriia bacterium]